MASSTTTTTTTTTTVTTTTTSTTAGPLYGQIIGEERITIQPQIGPETGFETTTRSAIVEAIQRVEGPQYLKAEWNDGVVTEYRKMVDGVMLHDYGDENLFHRIWFDPVEIDVGFIVEGVEYTISIWNAYYDQDVTVTSVVESGDSEGTSITHASTPFDIEPTDDTTATVTVYRSGPPTQNTTYTFTIDGEDYETVVTGIRVNAFPAEPDWDRRVRAEIIFETVVERIPRYFDEQRRPLREDPYRRISFQATAQALFNEKLKHLLTYGHDKVFGVPIYSEHCYPSASFNGSSTINLSNTTDKLWHLNNLCEYVVIIDHSTWLTEIKEIDTVNSTSIDLLRPVEETFVYSRVIVYPMIVATLDTSVRSAPHTDDLETYSLGFTEYEIGTGGIS
jgi:hypothetical protein